MKLSARIGKQRQNRRFRVRNRIRATSTRPRLSVHRSNKHIYAQIIDDQAGKTLVSASTAEKSVLAEGANGGNKAAAEIIGKLIAERATEKGLKEVVFDRGQYRYHGRIAALADAARAAGLEF
ncbi:MAG: rplR [Planctomycetaceae bacterium]|nr:rplR [Planctomycetaceae bacterium]